MQYLKYISNGDTAVFHLAVDLSMNSSKQLHHPSIGNYKKYNYMSVILKARQGQ